MGAINDLQAAGFQPNEINSFAADKRAALLSGGFSDKEVNDYLGDKPEPNLASANGSLARTIGNAMKPALATVEDMGTVYGPIEASLNAASGLLFGIPTGIAANAIALGSNWALGTTIDPKAYGDFVQKLYTFHPYSGPGERLVGNLSVPLQAWAEVSKETGEAATRQALVNQPLGRGGQTSSPIAAGIGATIEQGMGMLPAVLLGALGRRMAGQIPASEDFANTAKIVAGEGAHAEHVAAAESNLRKTYEKTGIDPFTVAEAAQKDPAIVGDLVKPDAGVPAPLAKFSEQEAPKAPSVSDIHTLADERGIPWDNDPAFLALTKEVTGKEHMDDLTPTERQAVYDRVKTEGQEGPTAEELANPVVKQLNDIRPLVTPPTKGISKTESAAAPEGETINVGMGASPAETIAKLKTTSLGQAAAKFIRGIVDDLQMKLTPMAADTASVRARAVAKNWANQDRLARDQWGQIDDVLKKNFTPQERAAMGKALDEQSVLEQMGQDTKGKGLETLPQHQRDVVNWVSRYAKQAWKRGVEVGMVKGEGLPSYMPRMIVNIGEDGTVTRVQSKGGAGGERLPEQTGRNIVTDSPNLRERKYLTPEETEAAAKARFGENTSLVQDIRALPMALARFERAIAGRELIQQIKEIGKRTGDELVSETEKPGTFTIDHPAFKTYQPRFIEEDGKVVPARDEEGNPIIDKVPLYVADEFKGPLKAIMSEQPGAVYKALMDVKAKAMGLIMYSPLIHNEVEFGRAFALMPIEMSKIGLAKGIFPVPKIYLDGNRLKNDQKFRRDLIANGLVPIGKRFGMQDITGIAEEPNAQAGRSWTAQAIGGAVGLVDKGAGEAVKRGIDTAGDFWHNTLLWDRVGDLQFGLAGKFYEKAKAAGLSHDEAMILAAHFANRYAGVLPNEVTSAGFRKAANFIFFSRSFTGGNIGAMKDAMLGAPRDVVAQLKNAGADEAAQASANSLARTFAQRKAIGAIIKDVALAHLGVALVSSALDYYHSKDFDKILEGYRDRWNRLLETANNDPWDASNPFADLRSLSPSSDNEPGKENRVRVGTNTDGTAIYMRMPTGKIGEEMEGYLTTPLQMMRNKVGTILKPLIEVYENDKGFGRKVYDPDAKTLPQMAGALVDIVSHIALDQFPVDSVSAAKDIVKDIQDGKEPKPLDEAKVLGPLAGVTFSKGAPGGPAVGEMYHAAEMHRNEISKIRPDAIKLIGDGDIEGAMKLMNDAHMTRQEIAMTIRFGTNPASRLSRSGMRRFNQTVPDAERARMEHMRESEAERNDATQEQ